ncbi:MAG: hypothetical protein SGI92_32175 [Bryobacteraceae bacterium]|nr:hypothetical protein [Bryobacteraceae bacterium]
MHRFVLILAAAIGMFQTAAYAQSVLNLSPSRVAGQPSVTFRSISPNVVEGREFYSPRDVTVDRSSTPSAVYVADFSNNRVLGWRDARNFSNGALADYVIGQLDRVSTLQLGPGTTRTLGLTAPSSVAVDSKGNVYVADTGNNRILRFPKTEIANSNLGPVPDLVIGQPGYNTSTVNQGGISEKSLFLSALDRSDMVFDSAGNLWVTDAGNNRVLRYPVAALDAGENRPAADMVIGQVDFVTGSLPTDPVGTPAGSSVLTPLNKSILRTPFTLAFDSEGRFYVGDAYGRVVVYTPELTTGRIGVRVVGIQVVAQGQQSRPDEYYVGFVSGLFTVGNRLGVVDAATHRIVLYDPFTEWPAESDTQVSPPARVVIGQQNFLRFEANRLQAEPSGNSFSQPSGVFYLGPELFVADTGNHRVLVLPEATNTAIATRVLGQPSLNLNAPNITDGRELFLYAGFGGDNNPTGNFSDGGGLAIDKVAASPHLYVADTFNNRVLGYRDVRTVRPGDPADIVIGQVDFQRTFINAPFNNANSLNNASLFRPSGLAVDSNGDLYVADSANGRVLRFPKPFEQSVPAGDRLRANLVLGQLSFNQKITDPSARNMLYPFGLAFTVEGSLLVSDAVHSRLLFFRRPVNGDFTNGQAAERVIGQPDFFTVGSGTSSRRLTSPRHIAIDTDDRLYVADAGNNRVVLYDRINAGANDPEPAFLLGGLSAPQGVWVSPLTGEIWVANTRGNTATRFPRFERLAISTRSDYSIPSSVPLALTQDVSGNLYIAEATNRIAMYYNALRFQIAGNYAERSLAPGTISILYAAGAGLTFSSDNTAFTTVPLPDTLADVQVLLNEKPVPLYFVGPFQVNFLVPMSAPDSGTAEIQVIRKSTSQILAVSNPQFARVAPALFVQGGAAQGQLAALNEDNTINTPSNPAAKGSIIQLFGTGQGFVPDAPPDGTAPTGQTKTRDFPVVYLGGQNLVKPEDVLYSGLAPGLVGVWQINARIPADAAPGQNDAVVTLNSTPTNQVPNSSAPLRTVISVKP